MQTILARLSEGSTWAGIGLLINAVGAMFGFGFAGSLASAVSSAAPYAISHNWLGFGGTLVSAVGAIALAEAKNKGGTA